METSPAQSPFYLLRKTVFWYLSTIAIDSIAPIKSKIVNVGNSGTVGVDGGLAVGVAVGLVVGLEAHL